MSDGYGTGQELISPVCIQNQRKGWLWHLSRNRPPICDCGVLSSWLSGKDLMKSPRSAMLPESGCNSSAAKVHCAAILVQYSILYKKSHPLVVKYPSETTFFL